MEILGGVIFVVFIVVFLVCAVNGLIHFTDIWEVIDRYYIKQECRHDFDRWTTPTNQGAQFRECKKCGWVERNYR